MSALEAFGLVAGITSIVSLVLTVLYYRRRQRQVKRLVYDVSGATPLAGCKAYHEDYTFSIIFQHRGHPEERIDNTSLRMVRIGNLGTEAIRREDIARSNPLRLIVKGVRTLFVQVSAVRRDVCNIALVNESHGEEYYQVDITFDFLDSLDGGLLDIATVGTEGEVTITGTVIGMPEGIKKGAQYALVRHLGWKASLFLGAAFLLSFVACIGLYRWVMESWSDVWLVAIPYVALAIPLAATLLLSIIGDRSPFPRTFAFPEWLTNLTVSEEMRYYSMFRQDMQNQDSATASPTESETAKSTGIN